MSCKFAICSFLSLLLAVLSAGCKKKELYRTNLLSFKKDQVIDPSEMRFAQQYFILDNVMLKLVKLGSNEEYQNDLAKKLEFSKDKKTLKIVLNEAFFSDGSQIKAKDVEMSLKRAVLNGAPHVNIDNLFTGAKNLKKITDSIAGIKVLSDIELQLKMTRPTKEILFFLSLTDLGILHKSQYMKGKILLSDWTGVTSGPYKVTFNEKEQIVLASNPKTFRYTAKMPPKVTFESYKGSNVIEKLKSGELDFGMITFIDYLKNIKIIENLKGYKVMSDKTDGIVYMTLNTKSGLFSKTGNRQWVQKKVLESFVVDAQYNPAAKKAYQFFLPQAKGYIPDAKVLKLLSHVDTNETPEDLKNGFTIKMIKGMKYYMIPDIGEQLSKVLGIDVKIDMTVPNDTYLQFINERNFDATAIGFGMSYKVLGEAMNIQYLSKNPMLLDPTGKIKSLLKDYQEHDNLVDESKIISKILKQMTVDSECVPLFYFSSPYFVNEKTLTAKTLSYDDSVKFYKMERK